MDAFGKALDLLGQTQRGEIAGWCRFCLEVRALGAPEQPHQPGCPADPALSKKLAAVRLKGFCPS